MPIPSKDILKKFACISDNWIKEVVRNQKEMELLEQQRNELLPLLMTGQVSVKQLNNDLALHILLLYMFFAHKILYLYGLNVNHIKEPGYVYILTNPSFKEDWVKIGKSSRPVNVRSKELDNTAVPLPFEIFATLKTKKYSEVEKAVHQTIDSLTDLRIPQNREFFNITPQEALNILKRFATMLEDAEITEYQKQKDECSNVITTEKQKPRHEKRKAFWTEFIQYCKDNDGLFSNNSPVGDNWISKGIGVPFGINMCAVIGYDFARVEIYFNSGEKELNKKVFDYLYAKKDEIEAEYGGSLIWERHTDKVTCRVSDAISVSCFEVEDRTEVFRFLKDTSERLSPIFHNYIIDYKTSL